MLEPAFHPGLDTAGSRDAISLGARHRQPAGRAPRHHPQPGRHQRQLTTEALRDRPCTSASANCALHHRLTAARTTLMDVITGRPARRGGTAFRRHPRPDPPGEVQITLRQDRKFRSYGVPGLSVFEPRTGRGPTSRCGPACARGSNGTQRCIEEVLATIRLLESRRRRRSLLSPRPKQFLEIGMLLVAGTASCCCRRAGGGHDRCRDRIHRRAVQVPGAQALFDGGGAAWVSSAACHVTVLHHRRRCYAPGTTRRLSSTLGIDRQRCRASPTLTDLERQPWCSTFSSPSNFEPDDDTSR